MKITLIIDRMPECSFQIKYNDVARPIHGNMVHADVGDDEKGKLQILFWKNVDIPGVEAKLIAILVDGESLEPLNRYINYFPDLQKHPDAPAVIRGCDHFGYQGEMVISFKQPIGLWKITAEFPDEKWIETDYGIFTRFMDKLTAK